MASELTSHEGPSPDEVRRRIDSLYDRAESDTGKFNATRAFNTARSVAIPRQRGAAGRGRPQEDSEPALGAAARQWFDTARAKLGPTVPATLPESRLQVRPDRASESARPARPVERPAEPLALEAPKAPKASMEPKAPTGVAWELTGGTVQEPTTGVLPELPAQRVAPPSPDTGALPALGGGVAAWPLNGPVPEPAPEADPLSDPLSGPLSALALPAVPDPIASTPQADFPTSGMAAYGAGPATGETGATATYATALSADPTAHHISGAPADMTTAAYDPGLPDAPASALAAPAPAVLTEPVTAPGPGHGTRAERVVAFARAQTGLPCLWGAVGPESYDAPGLTQAAWKAAGVMLPRTTQAQWGAGVQVSLADAQVGDLVFFNDDLGHVGIWSGDGMMIHAPGPGALIREESVFFAGQSAIKGAVRPA
ncbi:NlpC/P60 family protein [Streptomyces sp. NPDC006372]|uniref:C40 family peptidase n=1 Tax=Streptomyces sp. NPDC006372 TaxID=3155599 RepID=UPI0033B96DB2